VITSQGIGTSMNPVDLANARVQLALELVAAAAALAQLVPAATTAAE
jgi:hypothetical protein